MAWAEALIRLYPRTWRRRYGGELRDLLQRERVSPRTVVDLLAGAIDARLNPGLARAQSATIQGDVRMTGMFRCVPSDMARADAWRSAGWMIGATLLLTVTALMLQLGIGPNSFSESLMLSAFPASLMLSNECMYFKRYSVTARAVLSGGGALFIILVMWGSVALGKII